MWNQLQFLKLFNETGMSAELCLKFNVENFLDRNARDHSSSSTEAGSALGPDWHEGLSLRGAEQVR